MTSFLLTRGRVAIQPLQNQLVRSFSALALTSKVPVLRATSPFEYKIGGSVTLRPMGGPDASVKLLARRFFWIRHRPSPTKSAAQSEGADKPNGDGKVTSGRKTKKSQKPMPAVTSRFLGTAIINGPGGRVTEITGRYARTIEGMLAFPKRNQGGMTNKRFDQMTRDGQAVPFTAITRIRLNNAIAAAGGDKSTRTQLHIYTFMREGDQRYLQVTSWSLKWRGQTLSPYRFRRFKMYDFGPQTTIRIKLSD